MKAEEAIRRIQDHMKVHHIGDGRHIHIKEALDMAIYALREQEGDNRLESDAVKNEPLTLDELRKMDGEPVFLVDLVHKSDPETPNLWGGWIVFTNHNTNGFIPRGGGFFSNYGYGKTWLAYRSNPKKRIVRMCRKEV